MSSKPLSFFLRAPSFLAWPAWLRIAAVAPLLMLLWLAVNWANAPLAP